MGIRAITIWQPWASLIIGGFKHFETRSWTTSYRGWLAIHAAKRWEPEQKRFIEHNEFVQQALSAIGYHQPNDLPRGAIIGKAYLSRVITTDGQDILSLGQHELSLGDWSPGRFAWCLNSRYPIRFNEPVTVLGRQGLWYWLCLAGEQNGQNS